MPFTNEKAHRLGHVPTVNNQAVQDAFRRWRVAQERPSDHSIEAYCVPVDSLNCLVSSDQVKFAITVDGSDSEVEATREYPSVKVGYIRVAGSFLELDKLTSSGSGPFVDPREVRMAHSESAFDAALPGSGLVRPGQTGVDTWRQELDFFLASTRFDKDSDRTLADALLLMHGSPGIPASSIELGKCPTCREASLDQNVKLTVTKSGGICPLCESPIYLADVLRTHEEYDPEGSNLTPLSRVMLVAERMMTLSYLDYFFASSPKPEDVLRQTVFISDGPLALFGVVAPLKRRFTAYNSILAQWGESKGIVAPLMVGVEKSGRFVEHAERIADLIPRGHVMRLPTSYINRITGRPSDNIYGRDEFYGRRFIYRTTTGSTLVITVPPKAGVSPYEGPDSEAFESYPALRVVCEVLDSVQTRLYKNAVIPVALAHHASALPLGVGQSVLRAMAQKGVGLPRNSQIRQRSPYDR